METIIKLLKRGKLSDVEKEWLESEIDKLSTPERRAVIGQIGDVKAPRNLFYNYQDQEWVID